LGSPAKNAAVSGRVCSARFPCASSGGSGKKNHGQWRGLPPPWPKGKGPLRGQRVRRHPAAGPSPWCRASSSQAVRRPRTSSDSRRSGEKGAERSTGAAVSSARKRKRKGKERRALALFLAVEPSPAASGHGRARPPRARQILCETESGRGEAKSSATPPCGGAVVGDAPAARRPQGLGGLLQPPSREVSREWERDRMGARVSGS
jgi:hypothetical protein